MEEATILLVDDDPDFVESNKDLLEAFGYCVLWAYDGNTGFEIALREQPDVMILDVVMTTPTEGYDLARKIAASPELRKLKVLLVTGLSQLPDGCKPEETWLPVERVMSKPIEPSQLIAEVEKALEAVV